MTVRDTWSKLQTSGETHQGFVCLRLSAAGEPALYAGRRTDDGREALLLEIPTRCMPTDAEYPDSAGFAVTAEPVVPGPSGSTRIRLVLRDTNFADMFDALAQDVVEHLAGESDSGKCVRTFFDRLASWRAFWKRHLATGLSAEGRRGLFGELYILQRALEIAHPQTWVVKCWQGPFAAAHDFPFHSASVKVKTSSAASPEVIAISNVKQLDDRGLPALYLFFLQVEETRNGDVSLSELASSIRGRLNAAAAIALDEALLKAGYSQAIASQFEQPRYSVRRLRSFRVELGFPRILGEEVPDGVTGVRFGVLINACSGFERNPEDVLLDIVQEGV